MFNVQLFPFNIKHKKPYSVINIIFNYKTHGKNINWQSNQRKNKLLKNRSKNGKIEKKKNITNVKEFTKINNDHIIDYKFYNLNHYYIFLWFIVCFTVLTQRRNIYRFQIEEKKSHSQDNFCCLYQKMT